MGHKIDYIDPERPAGAAWHLANELHATKRISRAEQRCFEAALAPLLEAESQAIDREGVIDPPLGRLHAA